MEQTGAPAADRPLKIFVIAGEPSGDLLGARLMEAIKRQADRSIRFTGIGGPRMEAAGMTSLFPMADLAVMGFAEVLPRAVGILRRMSRTAQAIKTQKPDVLVTIDAPSFCFGVLRKLRKSPIRKIHYVAPTVWAWRPRRARKIARLLDHLMVLLPFEPPYFEKEGLATTFVGHPILESDIASADGARFRLAHAIADDSRLLCVLLGSRRNEVKIHLPVFTDAIRRLHEKIPSLHVVVPTLSTVAEDVRTQVAQWPVPVTIVDTDRDKYDAMAAADAALAVSGTVSLELALSSLPSVITYRVHAFSAFIVRRLMILRYANLVNWLLDREAVPEFIQEACRGDLLADAVIQLLEDPAAAQKQQADSATAMSLLAPENGTPSDAAAAVVLKIGGEMLPRNR